MHVTSASIEKEIRILSPAYKVWEVLTSPIYTKQWANAFSEGTYVETNWEKDSPVIWKDKDGYVGAKGIVVDNEKYQLLKIAFYDDVNADETSPLGEYHETYSLKASEGVTLLSIEAGPLSEKDFPAHTPLWDSALQHIKLLAEKK